jgi:hypothetical protein
MYVITTNPGWYTVCNPGLFANTTFPIVATALETVVVKVDAKIFFTIQLLVIIEEECLYII